MGITLLPLDPNNPLSLLISGNYRILRYKGGGFDYYDNNKIDSRVSIGYNLDERMRLRTGIFFTSTKYPDADGADKDNIDLYGGFNWSIFKSNVFDFEFGYSRTDASFVTDSVKNVSGNVFEVGPNGFIHTGTSACEYDDDLQMLYFSPRLSRSLGTKTGISFSYTYRKISNFEDYFVYGFTASSLSPWASVWDGQAYKVNIKTYMIPKMIISLGIGYTDKKMFKTLYVKDSVTTFPMIDTTAYWMADQGMREDERTMLNLGVERPIIKSGIVFKPSFNFEYTRNKSSNELFDYEDITYSVKFSAVF